MTDVTRGPGGAHGQVIKGTVVAGGSGGSGSSGEYGAGRAAERSAERAAALAVTEGFHPLRVRPYVGPSDDGTLGGTTARPLIDVDPDGGPATTDLGLFPTAYAEMEAAEEYPAEHGPLAGELSGGGGGERSAASATAGAAAAAAAHGRHRRRRRGIVVAAAAVAASALAAGAVAVTGSVMGEENAGTRALPEPSAATPDVTLPADAAPGAVTEPVAVTHHPPMRATTSPAPTAPPKASATPTVTATATTAPPSATATATPSQSASPPVASPSDDGTLRLGASGAEVRDLQQRLTQVWVYAGPVNGTYDQATQRAVATFQIWYGVQGDPAGVYGPATRAALVAATSPSDNGHHHR
ncbi:peptidoglycan-binding domain-containing protein [Streptomyces sp. NRRL F-5123]|uniref:peptidoglycan-binding domain-containing protein n=1 Tax=Streptomyces sp. NRRL F-5123 TaxID=1463856 RepID=UPI00131C08AA|nr:peptidoglycan-binding domain-containing protein [Streptomyces sp. NRRL F-5123]